MDEMRAPRKKGANSAQSAPTVALAKVHTLVLQILAMSEPHAVCSNSMTFPNITKPTFRN